MKTGFKILYLATLITVIIAVYIMFSGCTVKSSLTIDDKVYVFRGMRHEYATIKEGESQIVFDRKKPESIISQILTLFLINLPDTEVNN